MNTSNNTLDAIEGLDDIDLSVGSEVEVALDTLASALADEFTIKKKRVFFRVLSLSDVLIEIANKYHKSSPDFSESLNEAADLAEDVVLKLKRVYDEELDEEDQEEIREIVSSLQDVITKAMQLKP